MNKNNNNKYPGFKPLTGDGNIRYADAPRGSRRPRGYRDDTAVYSNNFSLNGSKKKKKNKKNIVAIITCIAVIIASVLAVGGVYFYSRDWIQEEDGDWDGNAIYKTQDENIINVLICGIDTDTENPGRVEADLTDTMMIASLNTKTKQATVLSIPRDTYVGNETFNGKINAIYNNQNNKSDYKGLDGLRKFLYEKYFLSTDHYVTIQMDGFRKVIDAIGGVECDVPHTFTLDGMTIKKGLQTLNGAQAERFVRERKSFINGDFGRIESQQAFLKAFAKKVLGTGKIDLAKLIMTANPYIKSDMGSVDELIKFSENLKGVDAETMSFNVIPVNGAIVGEQSVQKIDAEKFAEIINSFFPRMDANGNVEYVTADMLDVR